MASCSRLSDPGSSPGCDQNLLKRAPCGTQGVQTEVQAVPGGWFCNKPANSVLSLSLFIQRVLPILRKSKPATLQEGRPKFSRKAHAKGPVSLGRARQVEQKETHAGSQAPDLFQVPSFWMRYPRHGYEDQPCSPSR